MKDPKVWLLEGVSQLCSLQKFPLKTDPEGHLHGCHKTLGIFMFVC